MLLLVYTEATWPLAVYDAEHWLAISGMTVNLSLIEQTLAVSCHNYWLRVGVTFEDIAAASPPSSPTGNNHEVGAGDEGDALYDAPIEAARGNATDSNVSASGFLRVDFPVAETSGQYLVSDDGVDAPIGGVEADQDGEVEAALALNNKASPDKEDENEKDEVGDQEEGMDRRAVESEKLYTLVVLSGDTARWMVPRMDDWVELSAVRRLMQDLICSLILIDL